MNSIVVVVSIFSNSVMVFFFCFLGCCSYGCGGVVIVKWFCLLLLFDVWVLVVGVDVGEGFQNMD